MLSQLREGGIPGSGLHTMLVSFWERQHWGLQLHPSVLPSPAGTGPEGDINRQEIWEHSVAGVSQGNCQDHGSIPGGGLLRWVLVFFAAAMLLVGAFDRPVEYILGVSFHTGP